ncbi:conserved Plasmodium protein, unknown function [Plasmodium chabaudi chabaudi]|uniref:Uncharacterized protein n=1 Tax=Plasmodium chabaudi chabaudi TaxID=31271 RepID=A0A4V0K4B4_PLACU|nr:conserved Plasmodium protein, unknown function [Plasmodium chabaudi chabaudi]VTZ67421.1 conserved Plasmodium protein, unknown function [Plasmodium chabaudi chabaudi]|eukprot:XP_736730.2 conserved Plasmodium protein, unknown function [Plasmodium chabaudi chabaudi]
MNRTHIPNNRKSHEGINMKSSINEIKKSKRIEKELSHVTNSTKKKSKKKQTHIKKIRDAFVSIESITLPNNLNLYTDDESVVSSKYKKKNKKKKKRKLNVYNNNDNSKHLKPKVVKKKNSKIIFLHNENSISTHSGESTKFQKLKKKKKIKKGTKKKAINKISILKHKSHESFPSTQNENIPELEPKQVNLLPLEIEINKPDDIEISKTPYTGNFNGGTKNLDNNEKIKDLSPFHGIENSYENYTTNNKENIQNMIKKQYGIIDKDEKNGRAYNNDMNINNFVNNVNSNDHNRSLFCELTEAIENDGVEQNSNRNINIRLKEEKEAEEEEKKRNDEHIRENAMLDNKDKDFDKKDDLVNLGKSSESNNPKKIIQKASLNGKRKKNQSEKKMRTKVKTKQKKKIQNSINDIIIDKKNIEGTSSTLILELKKMKKKLSGKRISPKKEYKEKKTYSDKLKDEGKDKKKNKQKDVDNGSSTKDNVIENVKDGGKDEDEKKTKIIDKEEEKLENAISKNDETGVNEEIKMGIDEQSKVKTKEKWKIENGEGRKIEIDEENPVLAMTKLEADIITIEDAELRKEEEKDARSEERNMLETQMIGKEEKGEEKEKPVLKKKKKNKGKQKGKEAKWGGEKGHDVKKERKDNEQKGSKKENEKSSEKIGEKCDEKGDERGEEKNKAEEPIEEKGKLATAQNMSNIVKDNKVNKILEKYIISKKEENIKRKYMNRKNFMDILDINEKRFKIDTINFFPHSIAQVRYSDIYFFFDAYEKELNKCNTGKNTIKLMKKLFKCEYIEMNNMELVLQIFDKIVDKLKKELKTESIVKIYDEEEHVVASKIMKYKNGNYDKYMYNKNKYGSNNENSMYKNNLFNQNLLGHQNNLFVCNRNNLCNLIFNSSQGEYIMGSHSFLVLQQWSDEYKLAMLRDKLEQMKKRKQKMNAPVETYIKSLRYGFIDNLFNICCLYDCKKSDSNLEYCDFPFPPQNRWKNNIQIYVDNMSLNPEHIPPMKMEKAVRILASS